MLTQVSFHFGVRDLQTDRRKEHWLTFDGDQITRHRPGGQAQFFFGVMCLPYSPSLLSIWHLIDARFLFFGFKQNG